MRISHKEKIWENKKIVDGLQAQIKSEQLEKIYIDGTTLG
jgi:hypothetical protein